MQHDSPSPVLEPLPKDSSVEPLHPQKLGRYENLELIGAGGMAEVYKAYDPSLKRYVALKLIKWEAPELISRFVQEARAQARVDHEHVCKIYEAVMDTPQTRPHIAMQYIAGKTL
ncbi:MAG TPA: protein kinase, partial [Acidobacteriota bacterium]|nr:protein kinase [Acidobacteriota bacterium]